MPMLRARMIHICPFCSRLQSGASRIVAGASRMVGGIGGVSCADVQLASMSVDELRELVAETSIFARATPNDKQKGRCG